ncbi:hypothetical protein BS50DRAFT_681738 [Corynespora cassiicola Philippines]|uniref:Zn(2)-C6 fungal-type domain-containing protein n=1 Tax=Corynespora cassiicola Philippines TaxID=1448308 RepID=A0A2T2N4A4_CORCC|nr:hypothetical protein BS50DRAFT_681738 [Corynespora cassiicola Philippines]
MSNPAYRPILPSFGRPRRADEPSRKRKRAAIACNACRTKKTACDVARPICSACEARDSECVYITKDDTETRHQALKRENTALNERNATLEELVAQLKDAPEHAAQDLLRRLRRASDPVSVLRPLPSGAASPHRAPSPVDPEQVYGLLVSHSTAYPTLELSAESIRSGQTLVSPVIPVAAQCATSTRAEASPDQPMQTPGTRPRNRSEHLMNSSDGGQDGLLAQSPDSYPRLSDLDIGFWTSVPVTDEYAAGAISRYLETDYPVMGLFDADLFVRDLVQCRFHFCSPFLVSALLAFASQAYTSVDQNGSHRSSEFEKEAEALWRVEKVDSLPTLAGLILLYMSFGTHGQSEFAKQFIDDACSMARRMKLFDVPDALQRVDSLPKDDQIATSSAAWGVFATLSIQSLFGMSTPTCYPPRMPLPLELKKSEMERQELDSRTCREADEIFASFCKLWVIASGIFFLFTAEKNVSLAFASSKYYQLLRLSNNLPTCAVRRKGTSPPALVFHIFYHAVIVDMFRRFIGNRRPRANSTSEIPPPEAIFAASLRQIKGLIFEYTNQHPSAIYSVNWHSSLLYVASAVAKNRADPDWRFYFQFCIETYQKLYMCFAFIWPLVQSLLAMAVENGAITGSEAERFGAGFKSSKRVFDLKSEMNRGGYIVDLDRAITDAAAATVDSLVTKFEEITMFNEFTKGIY